MSLRERLGDHGITALLAGLTVLAVPAWLMLGRWVSEDVSGWSRVAQHHGADARELTGSRGIATVALQIGQRPRTESTDRRGARACIEVGLHDGGFWRRSLRSSPAPALFIPWRAVRQCDYFSAWLQPPLADVRLIVQDAAFERACAAHMRAAGANG